MANQSKLEQLEAQVAELKQKQAEFVSSTVFTQELQEISARVVVLENNVTTIEDSLTGYTEAGEFTVLNDKVDTLVRDFTGVYRSLDELVRMAGYESSEDFLQLGRDIVNVNLNIKALEKKLEQLRAAMALFVNQ
jgi:DNA repair exonuclease SbcCD ATPase subunit